MSSSPNGVRIGAVDNRDKVVYYDLMKPGPATPWEDRGAVGVPKAFIQTVIRMLKAPTQLLRDIRRPETDSDSRIFGIVCCVFWGLSGVVHGMLAEHRWYTRAMNNELNPKYDFAYSAQRAWMQTGLEAILFGVGAWILVRFLSNMHYNMVKNEMLSKAPKVLNDNLFFYCLASAPLALVPLAGPPLAIIWSLVMMGKASMNRMYVSKKGAIIAVALITVPVLVALAAAWLLQWVLWNWILQGDPVTVSTNPIVQ